MNEVGRAAATVLTSRFNRAVQRTLSPLWQPRILQLMRQFTNHGDRRPGPFARSGQGQDLLQEARTGSRALPAGPAGT